MSRAAKPAPTLAEYRKHNDEIAAKQKTEKPWSPAYRGPALERKIDALLSGIKVELCPKLSGPCLVCRRRLVNDPAALCTANAEAIGIVCMSCVTELGCAYAKPETAPKPTPPPELSRSGGGK